MALIPLGDAPSYYAKALGPDRWCLRHGDDILSWGELDRRATRRAWALKKLGVGKNDLVMLGLPNCNALHELTFAAWKLGATPSVVSWRLPLHEFKAILDLGRPKAVIVANEALAAATKALPPDFGLHETEDRALVSEAGHHWKAMTSGGSTGRPKLIIDHFPSMFDPEGEQRMMGMPANGVVLNPGPCYHNAPFSLTHFALSYGCRVVGMEKFDAEEALRIIERDRVQWVNFVPTMMSRILRLPPEVRGRYDVSSLEAVWHMAAPCPAWLKEAWIDWLGPEKIWEMYGGTERQGITILNGVEWLAHRGSVGRPLDCEARILDEEGKTLPAGEIGEIFLRPAGGQGSTYHYVGAETKADADGFESLGDFGWLDTDGYLYIADRRTDMILSGGANIYPAEIEAELMAHPGVLIAVVIGLPDEDMGALPHALINIDPNWPRELTAEELRTFLTSCLARNKIPRTFEFVDEALRDDAGKVRRGALREQRIERRSKAPR